jgi:hypothetical protein
MPNYAGKAPSSTLRPLSLATVIHSASFAPLMLSPSRNRAGEERATCQGTTIHAVAAFHCRATLDTPLQLSRLRVTARNAQQCQGTFVRTATTLVVAPVVAWLPSLPPTEKGKEWQTMPWHHCLLCHRLSALRPLSLSREQARDGRQWQQGTIFRLPPLSSCTVIRAAHRAIKRLSCQAIKPH